ncbi:MAG: efflux RND transporter periplasmic adaptor subunit [Fuerstiella sp.]
MPFRKTALTLSVQLLLGTVACSVGVTQSADKAIPVRAVTVQAAESSRSSTQPATIAAFYRAEIRARITGYVTRVHADIGTAVSQGDVLAEVDVPEMDAELVVRQETIARLQAELKQMVAGIELQKSGVSSAKASLQQVKAEAAGRDAQLAADEAELQRVDDLVRRGSVEPRLLDEARKRRDSSLAQQTAARSAIGSAEAEVGVAESRLASAEAGRAVADAKIRIAEAELTQLRALLAFRQIVAPFDGIVTHRLLNPGDLVSSSEGRILFEVCQVDKVRCRIAVPERDAAFINQGDRVRLTLPSFAETEFEATVSRTTQSLAPETRTMLVEADLPNSEGRLLPGMFGQATISSAKNSSVGVLPARAIRFAEDGSAYVYVVQNDSRVKAADIRIGNDDGTSVEVIEGLKVGQTVVDAHLKRFSDGQLVQVVK